MSLWQRLRGGGVISKLAVTPPAPRAGRTGLAIATVAKNEARYIGEWARFHALAGVDHVTLYDNGSTDGTAEVLRAAIPATVIPWDQKLQDARRGEELHNQALAFAHAVRNFGPAYRWMAFVDVDEFIVPKTAASIPEALEPLDHAACVSLPWAMFGRCGHDARPDGPVLGSYLHRARDPRADLRTLKFKCIVDPCRVTAVQVHAFEIEGRAEGVNDVGVSSAHGLRQNSAFVSFAALQLNHYYTRSNAELQAKIARGSNKTVEARKHDARVMRNVEAIERDTVEDHAALDFLARHGRQEA